MTQAPLPTACTATKARTEHDYLTGLSGVLVDIEVQSRINHMLTAPPTLTAISPTNACLHETITCHVFDDGPVYAFSWGDTIPGDTIEEIAHAIKRVVTAKANG